MDTRANAWDTMAAWMDEKHKDEGDLWHRALIDPPVLRLLGAVAKHRVLDIGCGNGYLARKLARLGAHVTAIDGSSALIILAKKREGRDPLGVTYHVADAAHLDMLETDSFEIVLSNMSLMDIADAEGAVREAARVLKPLGRFIASLSHPCFDVISASAWVVERTDFTITVWRKVSRYREVFQGWAQWKLGPDAFHQTPAYHRPLSWYFRVLQEAGFVVTALEEPEPSAEFLEGSDVAHWIAQIPLHCVIEARKMPMGENSDDASTWRKA